MAILDWLREKAAPWLGPKLSRDRKPAWMLGSEKIKAQLTGFAGQFWFLPYIDTYTQETEAIRQMYPVMLRDSTVKAALFSKLFNVASLDLDVQPDGDGPRAKKVAGWVRWALLHSRGGIRGLVENTVFPAALNGFGLAEKVWGYVEHGEYRGNVGLAALKSKDPKIFRLGEDQYRNLGGVWSILKSMEFYPISNFVFVQHMPLYGANVGTSDLRAAYRAFWMIDTVEKLRMIGLEKWGSPFLVGKYGDANTDKAPLDAALANVKRGTWISIPESAQVEAVAIANLGTSDYSATIKDLMHEITLGINFATLQSLEGNITGARAATQVHRDMSELPVWYIQDLFTSAINDQLVPDLVDLNMVGAGYPQVSLGGINDTELKASLEIDDGLRNRLGMTLSEKELHKKYRRQPPDDPQDALAPPSSPLPGGPFSPNGSNGNAPAGSQADSGYQDRSQLQDGDEEQQFDDDTDDMSDDDGSDDYAEPPDPKAGAGSPPASDDVALAGKDGANASRLLASSIHKGSRTLSEIASEAVARLLKSARPQSAKNLFNAAERQQLADAIAATNTTADLLGRARIHQRAEKVKSGLKLFAEDATPFEKFDESPVTPLPPSRAIEYFRGLFPSLKVPARLVGQHERQAFTLAKATEDELLGRVQNAIGKALETGEIGQGQAAVTRLLDDAGAGDESNAYSEMVFRTNMLESYNVGAQRQLAEPKMAELFPVYQYLGIADGRERPRHHVHFDRYYDSSVPFAEVRDSVAGKFDGFNCRCSFAPVGADEWADLQAKGQRVATFDEVNIFTRRAKRMGGR